MQARTTELALLHQPTSSDVMTVMKTLASATKAHVSLPACGPVLEQEVMVEYSAQLHEHTHATGQALLAAVQQGQGVFAPALSAREVALLVRVVRVLLS